MNAISRLPAHAPGHAPDLKSYDRIVVAFSGGKDSVACLLTLLEGGVPPERIDVYHHDVDGNGPHSWTGQAPQPTAEPSPTRSACAST